MHPRGIEPRKPLRACRLRAVGFASSLQMRGSEITSKEVGSVSFEGFLRIVRAYYEYSSYPYLNLSVDNSINRLTIL